MKKFLLGFLCLSVGILGSVGNVHAGVDLTTGATLNLNNALSEIDYKLSDSEVQTVYETVLANTGLKGVDRDETEVLLGVKSERNLSDVLVADSAELKYVTDDTRTAKTWLINNNVLSRLTEVDLNSLTATHRSGQPKDNEKAKLSDLYMLLYKAENGVIPSNTIYMNRALGRSGDSGSFSYEQAKGSSRSGNIENYWDDGVNASVGSNDFVTYISPNVKELYISEMYNLGIVEEDEIAWKDNPKYYSSYFKTATSQDWGKTAENSFWNISKSGNPLGKGIEISGTKIIENNENMLTTEKISMLDALSKIAKFMRVSENISYTEARVVAYKYGLTKLCDVPQEYLDDIYYLVCAGIISFDGTGPEYLLDDSPLLNSQMYDLVYRVANKGARYSFSYVQLTDSESTFMDLGYCQNDISIFAPNALPLIDNADWIADYNTKVEEDKQADAVIELNSAKDSGIHLAASTVLSLFEPVVVHADTTDKTWVVTKVFDTEYKTSGSWRETGNKYTYNCDGKTFKIEKNANIKDVESIEELEDPSYRFLVVKFKVTAKSSKAALNKVNKRINLTSSGSSAVKKSLSGLTKLDSNGTEVTMITQSSLKALDDIVVVADRVLKNTKTGATCLIQGDVTRKTEMSDTTSYGYALIGTNIISGCGPVWVEFDGEEVYYNMQLIMGLLTDSDFKNLGFGTNSKVRDSIMVYPYTTNFMANWVYDVEGQANPRAKFSYIAIKPKKKGGSVSLTSSNGNKPLYSTATLYKGLNSLSRTFELKVGDSTYPVTLIMDLVYFSPGIEIDLFDDSTVSEYQNQMYQRPDDNNKVAQMFWDRNMLMSNALANMLYGTGDNYKQLVPSGYLCPKLTVLVPKGFPYQGLFPDADNGFRYLNQIKENRTWISINNSSNEEKKEMYSAWNKFLYENLVFDSTQEHWIKLSDGSIESGLHIWYAASALKDLVLATDSTKYGDDTVSAYATELQNYYNQLGCDQITVGIAINSKQYTSSGLVVYKKAGSNAKNPIAAISTSNSLYRNLEYPQTIFNEKKGTIVPTLKVEYKNKKTGEIKKVTVRSECSAVSVAEDFDWCCFRSEMDELTLMKCVKVNNDNALLSSQFAESPLTIEHVKTDGNKVIPIKSFGEIVGQIKDSFPSVVNAFKSVDASGNFKSNMASVFASMEDTKNLLATCTITPKSGYYLCSDGILSMKASSPGAQYAWGTNSAMIDGIVENVNSKREDDDVMYYIPVYYLGDKFKITNNPIYHAGDCYDYYVDLAANQLKIFVPVSTKNLGYIHQKNSAKWLVKQQPMYAAGVNERVINSMLAKWMGLTEISELQDGAELHIGNTVWYKCGDYWESHPLQIGSYKGDLSDDWVKKLSAKGSKYPVELFRFLSKNVFAGYKIEADSRMFSLYNYVDNNTIDVGTGLDGSTILSKTPYKRILVKNNNGVGLCRWKAKKGVTTTDLSVAMKNLAGGWKKSYITLKIQFTDVLYAYPVDELGKVWELSFTSDATGAGYDLALFDSELNFNYDTSVNISVNDSDFGIPDNLVEKKAAWNRRFTGIVMGDWYGWLKTVVLLATIWLFFMTWISYFVLQRGIAYKFFDTLAKPSVRGEGIDVVKIFTLGLFNINARPTAARMFTTTVVLILIDVLVFYIL